MLLTVFIVLCCFGFNFVAPFSILSTSQTDGNICCIRDEWQGLLYLDYGIVFIDQNTAYSYINGSVTAAYSFSRKKIYFGLKGVEQSPLIPKPEPYDTIMLYDFAMGMAYVVQGGECQKSGLEQNMTRQCVPQDADLLSTGLFGPLSRKVDTYQFLVTSDITWRITAVVAKQDLVPVSPMICDPIRVSYFVGSANPDSGSLYGLELTDIGPIQSPDVFNIPEVCKHL